MRKDGETLFIDYVISSNIKYGSLRNNENTCFHVFNLFKLTNSQINKLCILILKRNYCTTCRILLTLYLRSMLRFLSSYFDRGDQEVSISSMFYVQLLRS